MKQGSIKKKLLLLILPLQALAIALIVLLNFSNTKAIMTEATYNELKEESNYNAKTIEKWRESILASLNSVQNTLETVKFSSDEEELAYLVSVSEQMSEEIPNGIYEGAADGTYLDGSGWVPDADYIIAERDWYKAGLNYETFTFGEPYMDESTGSFIVSASVHLNRTDKKDMVAAVDIPLTDITQMVSQISVMDAASGYAFLVDNSTSTILAHKDEALNAKIITPQDSDSFLASVSNIIATDTFQIQTIDQNGDAYFVAVQPIAGTRWVLVSCVSENEIFAQLRKTSTLYILIAVVAIGILGVLISRMIHTAVSPIKGLTESISRISSGDFTEEIEPKGNDEITVVSRAMKDYVRDMSDVIFNIRKISDELDQNASIGMDSSVTLNDASNLQAQSMKDMQSTIEQLAYAVNEIAENATTLAQVVDATNTHGTEANDKMRATVSMADSGYREMQHVQVGMGKIVTSMKELETVVDSVGIATEEINGIIQLIGNIAAQTNLLSLNASIEAARAGEAGRGFAVVADEIGNLADESAHSVQKIGEIISNITQNVGSMVEKTRENVFTIEDSSNVINKACDSFHEIYEEIEETSKVMDYMMKEIEQVNDVATNMAAISEEQSASTEEVSATIANLTVNSQEVAEESTNVEKSAKTLSNSAKSLTEYMERFQINQNE